MDNLFQSFKNLLSKKNEDAIYYFIQNRYLSIEQIIYILILDNSIFSIYILIKILGSKTLHKKFNWNLSQINLRFFYVNYAVSNNNLFYSIYPKLKTVVTENLIQINNTTFIIDDISYHSIINDLTTFFSKELESRTQPNSLDCYNQAKQSNTQQHNSNPILPKKPKKIKRKKIKSKKRQFSKLNLGSGGMAFDKFEYGFTDTK